MRPASRIWQSIGWDDGLLRFRLGRGRRSQSWLGGCIAFCVAARHGPDAGSGGDGSFGSGVAGADRRSWRDARRSFRFREWRCLWLRCGTLVIPAGYQAVAFHERSGLMGAPHETLLKASMPVTSATRVGATKLAKISGKISPISAKVSAKKAVRKHASDPTCCCRAG